MGGKRAAGDQHEILDLLYTPETERRAKKMARKQARADKAAAAAKRVPKAKRTRKSKRTSSHLPAPAPSRDGATRSRTSARKKHAKRNALIAVALSTTVGAYLYLTGFTVDPDVRQDRAACQRIRDAVPEADITTTAEAETTAANLFRLGRFKMSTDLSEDVRRAASAALQLRALIEAEKPTPQTPAEKDSLNGVIGSLRDTCADLGA